MALAESALSYFTKFVCTQFPHAPENPTEVSSNCVVVSSQKHGLLRAAHSHRLWVGWSIFQRLFASISRTGR
jgi:hypothetical protein